MSTAKHAMHKTKSTPRKSKAQMKLEAKLRQVEITAQAIQQALPCVAQFLVDEEAPVVSFAVKYTSEGRYLASLTIDQEPRNQIAFGSGDTPLEALNGLEVRIEERGFGDAFTYQERQEMKKQKAKK